MRTTYTHATVLFVTDRDRLPDSGLVKVVLRCSIVGDFYLRVIEMRCLTMGVSGII